MLETIWFFLWGLLWAVFFMTDGFDLGIGTLLPWMGKTDTDRRIMLRSMGPVWDGNEVWLITAGGVTFAAFPQVYAVMFSALYTPLMLILFGLILRGVAIEFRGKMEGPAWRRVWDGAIFCGSALPALLFGVAFANIFQGIPFDGDGIYQGTLFTLLNPYGLAGGVFFLLLFMLHGALWLAGKTDGALKARAAATAAGVWIPAVAVGVIFLGASAFKTDLYANYLAWPVLFAVPAAAVAALLTVRGFLARGAHAKAWLASALAIVGVTFFGIIGLFPALFPSSIDPAYSLTAFNAASSPLTLKIMLTVVILFVPVVIAYQGWTYFVFRGKITEVDLASEEAY